MKELDAIRGGLIVSCQAIHDSPLSKPDVLSLIAATVAQSGAVAIRAEGIENIEAIRATVSVPIIGLWKDGTDGLYITPTLEHALAVSGAGADIVAIDGTLRPRPDGRQLSDVIARIHTDARRLVMADVSTIDEGEAAQASGADLVATTLAGYTPYTQRDDGPDLELVGELASRLEIPVVAEGRIRTPRQARQAIERGAWAVVVGTAITDPAAIAALFVAEVAAAKRRASAARDR